MRTVEKHDKCLWNVVEQRSLDTETGKPVLGAGTAICILQFPCLYKVDTLDHSVLTFLCSFQSQGTEINLSLAHIPHILQIEKEAEHLKTKLNINDKFTGALLVMAFK